MTRYPVAISRRARVVSCVLATLAVTVGGPPRESLATERTTISINDIAATDTAPPVVQVLIPNGREIFYCGTPVKILWSTLASNPCTVDIYLSPDYGTNYDVIELGTPDDGSFFWTPQLSTSTTDGCCPVFSAMIKIVAHDCAGNVGEDTNDTPFSVLCIICDPSPGHPPPPCDPKITIDDVAITEGDSGKTLATLKLLSTIPTASPFETTVQYSTADGTATLANDDYQATSGVLTFADNAVSATITIPVNGDFTNEPDESFLVRLLNPTNAVLRDSQAVVMIDNDDDTTPPIVQLLIPNGGETFFCTTPVKLLWNTMDSNPCTVDLYVSLDYGASYDVIVLGTPGDGSFIWTPNGSQGTNDDCCPVFSAMIKVVAHDCAGNTGQDTNDNPISIFCGICDPPFPHCDRKIAIDDVKATEGNSGKTIATLSLHLSVQSISRAQVKRCVNDLRRRPSDWIG